MRSLAKAVKRIFKHTAPAPPPGPRMSARGEPGEVVNQFLFLTRIGAKSTVSHVSIYLSHDRIYLIRLSIREGEGDPLNSLRLYFLYILLATEYHTYTVHESETQNSEVPTDGTHSHTRNGHKLVRAWLPLLRLQASKLFRGRAGGRAAACSGGGTPPAALVPAAAASSCRVDASLPPAAECRRG